MKFVIKICNFLKLVVFGSEILLVDVTWFAIGCCEIKVVLFHPATCALFHRKAYPVVKTTVSKLLRLRFMQLHHVLGFHRGKNNLHFLQFCEVTLLGNCLQILQRKYGSYFQEVKTTKTILLFEVTTTIFHLKVRKKLTN